MIVEQGERVEHLFNITAGVVKLYKLLSDGRRQITGFLSIGDFLGMALTRTHAFSAEAVTYVSVCRYPRSELEQLLEEHPRIEHSLLGNAVHELAAAQDQMVVLGRKNASERLASFLIGLSRRAGREGLSTTLLHLPMSRADIADYLGLTTETVSRTFSKLAKSAIIRLEEPTRVRVLRLDELEVMASA
jgi:CRP/FNR family transcriptional regulator